MDCEMCGNPNAHLTVLVEGVKMQVCRGCSHHGSRVRVPKKRTTFSSEQNDLIESIHPDLPKMLKQFREQNGLTQEQLASRMNMKVSVYQHFENGSRTPSIAQARKLESQIHKPIVVRIKVGEVSQEKEDRPGMTIGDMIKKRR